MNKHHFIHCQDGRITANTDTSLANLDQIIHQLGNNQNKHLILYFHGGLVSKQTAIESARQLKPFMTDGYPVFFVWESGPLETIINNLEELPDEPVFTQLLLKILGYVFDIDQRSSGFSRKPKTDLNQETIQADLQQDLNFIAALHSLPLDDHAFTPSRNAPVVIHSSTFARAFAQTYYTHPTKRGVSALWAIAELIWNTVQSVNARFDSQRDHGWATITEELVRHLRIAGSGLNEWGKALQWNPMKTDINDAFGPNPDLHAATAFLSRLNTAIEKKKLSLDKITFVGHSAGCIYLRNWLAKCAEYPKLATIKQDVIFLAPATTYFEFAQTLNKSEGQINNFRMFSMCDQLELEDQLIPGKTDWKKYIYPSSLLYLVSGILEFRLNDEGELIDAPDEPILGMQRFFLGSQFDRMPEVKQVRQWLNSKPKSLVWSMTTPDSIDGMRCKCNDHGQFGGDKETRLSLKHILNHGF